MSFNFTVKEFILGNGTGLGKPFQFYRRGFNLGGIGSEPTWQDIILHGNTALTLVNSKADGLNYLKLFGDTEQLPETYLDTVTLSGGCEQRNLPVGYTQVEYIESSGTQYIDTGILPNDSTGYKITLSLPDVQTDVLQAGTRNDSGSTRFSWGVSSGRAYVGWGANYPAYESRPEISANVFNTVSVNYLNDRTYKLNNTTGYSNLPTLDFTVAYNFLLFGFMYVGTSYPRPYKLKEAIFTQGSSVTKHFIPAKRNSDNEIGLYDVVNNVFYTNAGTGTFTAGSTAVPTPDTPLSIISNNGVIKYSANMCNVNAQTALVGYYISNTGVVTADTFNWMYQDFIPVKPNTTYTLTISTPVYYVTISEYSTADDSGFIIRKAGGTGGNTTLTITTGATTNYVRFGTNIDRTDVTIDRVLAVDWMLNVGNTMAYAPYSPTGIYTDGTVETVTDSNGLTATAERLLAVGDYKDTQEVLSGSVTRNVGIKVLDGTEEWIQTEGYSNPYVFNTIFSDGKNGPGTLERVWCTHFQGVAETNPNMPPESAKITVQGTTPNISRFYAKTSVASTIDLFKQFLADQYNAGTPVIVVYPLSTATTSTVTGQFLSKSPVTQTAGSISNLPIIITESQKTVPTPQQPLPINCNNGVVKYSANMCNVNAQTALIGYYISTSGVVTAKADNWIYQNYIPVKPNTTYTLTMNPSVSYVTISEYSTANDSGFIIRKDGSSSDNTTFTITTGSNTNYIRFGANLDRTDVTLDRVLAIDWMLNVGDTMAYHPYVEGGIYVDGTTETVEVTGKNLFDKAQQDTDYYYNNSGVEDTATYSDVKFVHSAKMPCLPNTAYTLSGTRNLSGNPYYYKFTFWDKNGEFISYENPAYVYPGDYVRTVTTPNNCYYIAFNSFINDTNVQLELGSTATTYEPYYNGGSATAEMLLKVGTYQDIQSVLDGEVTRNVGVKVLDGTENWQRDTNDISITKTTLFGYAISADSAFLMTHFGNTYSNTGFRIGAQSFYTKNTLWPTVTAFKQFLTDQYNAGNPVVVIYPLAMATTESVTAQPLTIQAGTNIVEITQASMDNLELEVSYKAGVEVTVTEIENAQLDNSVEVTING